MRLHLGCAAYRQVEASTAAAMVQLALRSGSVNEVVAYGISHGYGGSRNVDELMRSAVDLGVDALVYHDADMIFTAADVDALVVLYETIRARWPSVEHHVVAAQYRSSKDPRVIVGTPKLGGSSITCRIAGATFAEAVEAERIGFGLVLLPTSLLRTFKRPRFPEEWDGEEYVSPDTVFGRAVQARGGCLWLTHAAGGVRHIVTQALGL